jgi:hypothetical protein
MLTPEIAGDGSQPLTQPQVGCRHLCAEILDTENLLAHLRYLHHCARRDRIAKSTPAQRPLGAMS